MQTRANIPNAEARAIFERLDRNHDGVLDEQEFSRGYEASRGGGNTQSWTDRMNAQIGGVESALHTRNPGLGASAGEQGASNAILVLADNLSV